MKTQTNPFPRDVRRSSQESFFRTGKDGIRNPAGWKSPPSQSGNFPSPPRKKDDPEAQHLFLQQVAEHVPRRKSGSARPHLPFFPRWRPIGQRERRNLRNLPGTRSAARKARSAFPFFPPPTLKQRRILETVSLRFETIRFFLHPATRAARQPPKPETKTGPEESRAGISSYASPYR